MKKQLSKKEDSFCRHYATCQNVREAAYLAGYTVLPSLAGDRLLSRQDIRQRIDALMSERSAFSQAAAGFRRLAFGSVADAIRLIDGERNDLDGLDLFMVSDIKIPKGGGMEIKFFDRQKALESLAAIEGSNSSDGNLPLYAALERSARLISDGADSSES